MRVGHTLAAPVLGLPSSVALSVVLSVVLSVTLGAGCGPTSSSPAAVRPAAGVPTTDRDPLPYTPAPSAEGRAGTLVSLTAAGGEDQARRMLPALLRAIRDADGRELTDLFAEEVGAVRARRASQPAQARSGIVQRILLYAQRGLVPPDVEIGALVDLERLTVSRASDFWAGRDMPQVVLPTDLVLEVPLLEPGRGPLRTVLGWSVRGHLVVRPGREARIVAM